MRSVVPEELAKGNKSLTYPTIKRERDFYMEITAIKVFSTMIQGTFTLCKNENFFCSLLSLSIISTLNFLVSNAASDQCK